ncbi:MAG: 30S ribosomal protein S12 methylthiotransferase RimO [Chloroflexi bacterium]|nr:30S ribosomal protein S12 methylthiotransferase RimO [Chloroflexota bacterium]
MSEKTFAVVTLGCPKNQVDSEAMSTLLLDAGWRTVADSAEADLVIVNTCAFVERAKQESIDAVLELTGRKRAGQRVVMAGCLAQRYAAEVARELPEVDGILGTRAWAEVVRFADAVERDQRPCWVEAPGGEPLVQRKIAGPWAYLKIADGCSAGCAFCAIPLFKGGYRSRPPGEVIAEAQHLAGRGVRELILVSQNLPAYGFDWRRRDALADLLRLLVEAVPDLRWIRLMYCRPELLTPRLVEVIAGEAKIVSYLDMPIEHAHPDTLRRMRRAPDGPARALRLLRSAMPDVAIRSSLIVGYPGETDVEFAYLLDFLREAQLDRVGVFTYSPEDSTPAAALPGQVPERVARERRAAAMALQRTISRAKNESLVGRVLEVLVEGQRLWSPPRAEGGPPRRPRRMWIGRSYRDAPEVDGVVLFSGPARPGAFVSAHITHGLDYDLVGEAVPTGR